MRIICRVTILKMQYTAGKNGSGGCQQFSEEAAIHKYKSKHVKAELHSGGHSSRDVRTTSFISWHCD